MKTVGIICEYNPFHLGHQKQFDMIRNILGSDAVIVCLMSGNFVQRGMPAIFDKSLRAQAAIEQIVALENLEATEEDIAEAMAVIARQNRLTVEQMKPYIDAEFEAAVVRNVLTSKAMKLVRDEADIVLC